MAANPGKELLREAHRAFGDNGEVATIMSIGAGKGDVWNMSTTSGLELKEVVRRAATNCEPVHEEMYSCLRRTSIYFRLNVERRSGNQLELSSASVSAYLGEGVVSDRIEDAIKSIHRRPTGDKLKNISEHGSASGCSTHHSVDSVTVIEIVLRPRPSLVDNFIGRRDILERMHRTHLTHRSSQSQRPAITVLSGLGGAGKTQTALKFAIEFEERLVNLISLANPRLISCSHLDVPVYFVNASTEETLKADLENIIRSRGSEHRSSSHHDALRSWPSWMIGS